MSRADWNLRTWMLLVGARDAMWKARGKELRKYGISVIKSTVLFIIDALKTNPTPTEIARWCYRQPNSVSMLLSRMEKDRLIKKVGDLDRKNLVRAKITPMGKEVLSHASRRESIDRIMSCLSDDEVKQLYLFLEKLVNSSLKELGQEPIPFLSNKIAGMKF